ncbi:uroplakin-3a isoform X2 [Mixophyes fleayi]|uniref:uroplakin-3a isoform X2 n=1 Tax=Mixophyes fleayi TaxID=3061075 RepID=UPI003F4DA48E
MINHRTQAQVPLLASSNICKFNPTQTTVALEKPYCFSAGAKLPNVGLFVVNAASSVTAISANGKYISTNAGLTAPYLAATFTNPNCTDVPVVSQIVGATAGQSVLDQYVIRVGSDDNCFNKDPCNGPLINGTAYRFKYVFYNTDIYATTNFGTDWSAQITTKNGKSSAIIDTWPGRRSGGMIVLTSILSVLTFLVLAGFIAAIVTNLLSPSSVIETTRHESQTTHNVPRKTEEVVEYATAIDPGERYATNQ